MPSPLEDNIRSLSIACILLKLVSPLQNRAECEYSAVHVVRFLISEQLQVYVHRGLQLCL